MDPLSSVPGAPGTSSLHDAKHLAHKVVTQNPMYVLIALGVVSLIALILAYMWYGCKTALAAATPAKSSGFVTAVNNMTHGGASPLWHLGNGDAGNGGSVDRASHPVHHMHPGAGRPSCGAWSADARDEAQALATVGSFAHDAYGERALQGAINAAYSSIGGEASAIDALTSSDAVLTNVMHKGGSHP